MYALSLVNQRLGKLKFKTNKSKKGLQDWKSNNL